MERIDFFKDNNQNTNTKRATKNWMKRYNEWAVENGCTSSLESLDAVSLNGRLEHYFSSVTKKDGSNYEPSSLGCMQAAIERYLEEKGLLFSIIKDREFKGSTDVIEGRAKFLRENGGLGRKPNRARSLNALLRRKNSGSLVSLATKMLVP